MWTYVAIGFLLVGVLAVASIRPAEVLTLVAILAPLAAVGRESLQFPVLGLYLAPAEALLYVGVIGIAIRLLLRPALSWQAHRRTGVLAWLLLVALIPGTLHPAASQEVALKGWLGIGQWVVWISLAMAYLQLRDIRLVQNGWLLVGAVAAVADTVSTVVSGGLGRVSGLLGDPNFWGTFLLLGICVPLVGGPRIGRLPRFLVAAVLFADGVLSGSRSFLVTVGVVVIAAGVLGLRLRSRGMMSTFAVLASLALVGAVILVMLGGQSVVEILYHRDLSARQQVYGWSLANAARYLITGIGPENMPLVYDQWSPYAVLLGSGKSAHNMYLQVLVSGGLLSGILFLMLLGSLMADVWRSATMARSPDRRECSLVILLQLVILLTEGMFLDLAWSGMLWVVLGAAAIVAEPRHRQGAAGLLDGSARVTRTCYAR